MVCRTILRFAWVGLSFFLASIASLDPVVTLAWGSSNCHGAEVKPANTEGLDARHVKTEAPSKLVTDQVFKANVTMKNTGGRPWGDGMKLRSNDPVDNMNWGTTFIYLGQGRGCKPGEQITFSSWLKAPSKPGKYAFQWRTARNEDDAMFGEPTASQTILVEARPAEPPAKPLVQDPSRKRVLTFDDFEYAGSFKVPDEVEGCGSAYTESGLALRGAKDGTKRLLIRTGLRKLIIYEAAIPDLRKLEGSDHSPLNVAPVKRIWGEIKLPGKGDKAIGANAGFWWDDAKNILYWSYYHGYTTGRPPVLGASRMEESGEITHLGPWYVPDSVPWFKSYWGGVTPLPKQFADRYTGGRRLALGFGGYYSICAPASRGPALAAIAEPDPTKNTLDMVELLTYPWPKDACAPRDGDYFVANCSWGGRAPESSGQGSWTMDDWVRAAVFIDLPEKHGFLALAYLGTGRIGYDYGAIRSAGHVNYWYFYDPRDLAAAARGARKPWEHAPHSTTRVEYPRGIRQDSHWSSVAGEPTGCCFDEEARLLYVYQRFCIDNQTRELFPCIHAYRIK